MLGIGHDAEHLGNRLQRGYGQATGTPADDLGWHVSVESLPGNNPIVLKAEEAITLVLLAGSSAAADVPGALAPGSVVLRGPHNVVAHVGYLQRTACVAVVVKAQDADVPPPADVYARQACPRWLRRIDPSAKGAAWHVSVAEALAAAPLPAAASAAGGEAASEAAAAADGDDGGSGGGEGASDQDGSSSSGGGGKEVAGDGKATGSGGKHQQQQQQQQVKSQQGKPQQQRQQQPQRRRQHNVGGLVQAMRRVAGGRPIRRVLLSGWHHGGALAQLLSTLVGVRAATAEVRCITFDAPRVANQALARLHACVVGCCYSVSSGADPLLGGFLGKDQVSVLLAPRRGFGYVRHARDPSFAFFPLDMLIFLEAHSPERHGRQAPAPASSRPSRSGSGASASTSASAAAAGVGGQWWEPEPITVFRWAIEAREGHESTLMEWLKALAEPGPLAAQRADALAGKLSRDASLDTGLDDLDKQTPLAEADAGGGGGGGGGGSGGGGDAGPGPRRFPAHPMSHASRSHSPHHAKSPQQAPSSSSSLSGATAAATTSSAAPTTAAVAKAAVASLGAKLEKALQQEVSAIGRKLAAAATDVSARYLDTEVCSGKAVRSHPVADGDETSSSAPPSAYASSAAVSDLGRIVSRSGLREGGNDGAEGEGHGGSGSCTPLPPTSPVRGVSASGGGATFGSVVSSLAGSPRNPSPGMRRSASSCSSTGGGGGNGGSSGRLASGAAASSSSGSLAGAGQPPAPPAQEGGNIDKGGAPTSEQAAAAAPGKAEEEAAAVGTAGGGTGDGDGGGSTVGEAQGSQEGQQQQQQQQKGPPGVEEEALGEHIPAPPPLPPPPDIDFYDSDSDADNDDDAAIGNSGGGNGNEGRNKPQERPASQQQHRRQPTPSPLSSAAAAAAAPASAAAPTGTSSASATAAAGSAEDHVRLAKFLGGCRLRPALAAAAATYYESEGFRRYTGLRDAAWCWNEEHGTNAFLAWLPESATLLVAFRGTASFRDVLQDVKSSHREHPFVYPLVPGAMVHTGFLQQLQGVVENEDHGHNLFRVAAELSGGRGNVQRVVVTGHSLGGGVATLAAPLLASAYPSADVCCYTFGCSRVANHRFGLTFRMLVGTSLRVVGGGDPVCEMPMGVEPDVKLEMPYSHIPVALHVHEEGAAVGAPPPEGKRPCSSVQHHYLKHYCRFVAALAPEAHRRLDPRQLWCVDPSRLPPAPVPVAGDATRMPPPPLREAETRETALQALVSGISRSWASYWGGSGMAIGDGGSGGMRDDGGGGSGGGSGGNGSGGSAAAAKVGTAKGAVAGAWARWTASNDPGGQPQ